jgi:hypothetical protein
LRTADNLFEFLFPNLPNHFYDPKSFHSLKIYDINPVRVFVIVKEDHSMYLILGECGVWIMNSNMRSRLDWLLPFILSGGMALGSLIGITSVFDLVSTNDPAGDIAGAAGALMLLICSIAGFIMAMLTVILAKLLHHGEPERVTLRFVVSILGGIVISILGSINTKISTIIAWSLLLVLPVLLAWFWRTKAIQEVKKPNE